MDFDPTQQGAFPPTPPEMSPAGSPVGSAVSSPDLMARIPFRPMAELSLDAAPEPAAPAAPEPFPPVTRSAVDNCSFPSWYPRYKSITPKARILQPVPVEFVQYLLADGIFLPADGPSASWSSDDEDDGASVSAAENDPTVAFPELHQAVQDTIVEYGAVAPKLNWSSPKDAMWITASNTMRCATAADVYLMLKSSSFITHDLLYAYDAVDTDGPDSSPEAGGSAVSAAADATDVAADVALPAADVALILRKWSEVNVSMEFRCFVHRRELVAISQRDPNYYEFLHGIRDDILDLVDEFYFKHLRKTFPNQNFTFDVYIQKPKDRVWLIDINPFASQTDSLLFSWDEILALPYADADRDPELRLLHKDDNVRSFSSKQYSAHQVPKDVVDASLADGKGIAEFAKQWREMLDKTAS
ncbi:D123-domain-containing protein, partial [Dipodascopsis tothii]|uniref:D123-domain-containing protein n=1 Tax=Dipodascopsis tothii TaxID=44089 RepID=UPI0034CDB72D